MDGSRSSVQLSPGELIITTLTFTQGARTIGATSFHNAGGMVRSKTFARSGLLITFSGIAALVFLSGCGANNSGSNSNPPPPSISVNVSPTTASLSGSGVPSFAAVVSNDSSNAGVTWSIGSGAGVLSASTLKGVTYTAPSSIGATTTVTLTATSKTDTAKTASAAITLDTPAAPPTITSVAASCVPSSVQTGQTSQCSATVTGTGKIQFGGNLECRRRWGRQLHHRHYLDGWSLHRAKCGPRYKPHSRVGYQHGQRDNDGFSFGDCRGCFFAPNQLSQRIHGQPI